MKNSSTKVLLVALFVLVTLVMSAVGVSAAVPEAASEITYESTVVFDGSQTFEKVVEDALASGKNTIIELEADVSYSADTKTIFQVGEQYANAVPTNTIKITSGENVDASGNPYGFVFNSNVVLNIYGNYVLDDIKLNLNANWTTGGCLQVPAGSLQVGHPNTAAAGQTADWGNVYMPTQGSLSGQKLRIYTGGNTGKTYRVVCAAFYGSSVTVKNPDIYFGGEASVDVLAGGLLAYNKNAITKITGRATLKLMDSASADWMGVTRDVNIVNEYGADVTVDTTGDIGTFELIGRTGGRYDTTNYKTLSPEDFPEYSLTINKGTFTKYFCMGRIEEGNPRINFTIDINGGTFNKEVYLGYLLYEGQVNNAYNIIGTSTITINDATFKNLFFCGSCLTDNTATYKSNDQTIRDVTITDSTFQAASGVTNSGYIFGGCRVIDDGVTIGNGTGTVGSTLLKINGNTSCVGIYGGSWVVSKNSTYKPEITIPTTVTINNVTTSNHVYGGSLIGSAGAKNSGAVTLEIKGGTYGGRLFAGSVLNAASAQQGGDTKLILSGTFTYPTSCYFVGGSLVSNGSAVHSGDSEIEVNTSSLKTHNGFYGGSWCDGVGSTHSGNSKVTIKSGNTYTNWTSARYAGSFLNNINTKHLGNSEMIFNNSTKIGGGASHGGSNLGNRSGGIGAVDAADNKKSNQSVGTAEKPVTMKVTINSVNGSGAAVDCSAGVIYAGNNIQVYQCSVYADSYFTLNNGNIIASHSAGSFATKYNSTQIVIPDADANDGITGGFGQKGNAYYTVNGGKVTGAVFGSGRAVNLDGSIYMTINGGTFTAATYALGRVSEPSSVSGNVVVKITGGTFNGDLTFGGEYNAANNTNGLNVVGGNTYVEIVEDGKGEALSFPGYGSHVNRIDMGRSLVKGDVIFKAVGNVPVNEDILSFQYGASLKWAKGRIVFDLSQCTGETLYDDVPLVYFDYYIKPFSQGETVSISGFDGSAAKVGDLATVNGKSFVWDGKTNSYEIITICNEYTDYDNVITVVDSASGKKLANGLGIYTEAVKVKFNNLDSAEIAIGGDVAAARETSVNNTLSKYKIAGSSIRLANPDKDISLAMRCRAMIHNSFFEDLKAADMGGYKINKIGFLVGREDGEPYTLEDIGVRAADAAAYSEGTFNAGERWATGQEADYHYFAAAITGYEDPTTVQERANTTIYFRAYVILEDANGVQEVLYIDHDMQDGVESNYAKSMVQAAKDAKTDKWYADLTDDKKAKVDEIIAYEIKA